MQNGHFRLLLHTPDSSSDDETVMKKYIAFIGTRASPILNVSRRQGVDILVVAMLFVFFLHLGIY